MRRSRCERSAEKLGQFLQVFFRSCPVYPTASDDDWGGRLLEFLGGVLHCSGIGYRRAWRLWQPRRLGNRNFEILHVPRNPYITGPFLPVVACRTASRNESSALSAFRVTLILLTGSNISR